MQNLYELMLLLKPQATADDEKKIAEQLGKLIKTCGKIVSSTSLGKKQLAYPIKKEGSGIYLLLTLELAGKEAARITEKLKLEELVLRHLLVKKDSSKKE